MRIRIVDVTIFLLGMEQQNLGNLFWIEIKGYVRISKGNYLCPVAELLPFLGVSIQSNKVARCV